MMARAPIPTPVAITETNQETVKMVLKSSGRLIMASEAVISSPSARAGGPAAMVLIQRAATGERG
jgi:hypothetical protein